MINLQNIKKAKGILDPEISSNLNMQGKTEFRLLCEGAGVLKILISKLEKYEKKRKKGVWDFVRLCISLYLSMQKNL